MTFAITDLAFLFNLMTLHTYLEAMDQYSDTSQKIDHISVVFQWILIKLHDVVGNHVTYHVCYVEFLHKLA